MGRRSQIVEAVVLLLAPSVIVAGPVVLLVLFGAALMAADPS